MPATSVPRIRPSITRTRRALTPSGGLNALTALETASMPVSEAPPLANAFSSTKMITKLVKLEAPLPMGNSPWRS